jgi:myo-inositol-1(or 4)-monophosphatase
MNFFAACEDIARTVRDATTPLIGTEEGNRIVGMGADLTPTKYIDKVAEDLIIDALREKGIGSYLISEEAGNIVLDGEDGTVYLDPIDGTYNATKNIPFYAVSLAFANQSGVIMGYVENLATGERFHAERTKGAFENGTLLKVSTVSELHESAMSIYRKDFFPDRVCRLGQKIRRNRQFGASALELSYVAAGKIDGFVDLRNTLRVTDAAAGILICREAGGTVTNLNGDPIVMPDDITKGSCLIATNGRLHQKVIEYLR